MARVLTNNISLQYAIETTLGVLPGSPTWYSLEPNDITTFGATITTVSRTPIAKDRQRKKGTVTSLESAAEFEHDLTIAAFINFAEGFVFAMFQGDTINVPTNVDGTTDEFDVPVGPVLLAGQLVYARGFTNAINNGIHEVTGTPTSTAIPVGTDIVDETPPINSTLEVAGQRFASAEIDIDVTGTVVTIARQSGSVDFTTMGVSVGQLIHVGGLTAGRQFSAGKGYFRVMEITTTTLVGDKGSSTLVTDPGTGETIDLLFGRFLANVSVDDALFLSRSFQFEAAYPDLDSVGTPEYEYSKGNQANTMAISFPLADKATVSFGFLGTDTEVPTVTRKTNAGTPIFPVQNTAFNTSSDIGRLRIAQTDETGLTTCFKDLTLTLGNNLSAEECLGTLGAFAINTGLFTVDLEAQILFTDSAVSSAVRNNETVTMDFIITNDDGAIAIDIPAMTLGGGDKEYPVNESVPMNLTGEAFGDSVLGTSIGISLFPAVPA